ncbi:MAG: hypothetical protein KatS3mg110_1791 [Pirellulaceae bacterium]|nr:MAG: hypothetical protein KatS3mg110_1791 [Pirellulaceae bacterium]
MSALQRSWLAAAILIVTTLTPILGAEDGWGWSFWNPFKSDKPPSKKVTASVTDEPKSSFHLPKLPSLPKLSIPSMTSRSSTARRPAPSGPSTWEKMTQGTKSFFSKAYDALTPWDDHKAAPPKPPTHPSSSSKASKGASSWWPWGKKSSSQGPKTVNEFIAQPRVTP